MQREISNFSSCLIPESIYLWATIMISLGKAKCTTRIVLYLYVWLVNISLFAMWRWSWLPSWFKVFLWLLHLFHACDSFCLSHSLEYKSLLKKCGRLTEIWANLFTPIPTVFHDGGSIGSIWISVERVCPIGADYSNCSNQLESFLLLIIHQAR